MTTRISHLFRMSKSPTCKIRSGKVIPAITATIIHMVYWYPLVLPKAPRPIALKIPPKSSACRKSIKTSKKHPIPAIASPSTPSPKLHNLQLLMIGFFLRSFAYCCQMVHCNTWATQYWHVSFAIRHLANRSCHGSLCQQNHVDLSGQLTERCYNHIVMLSRISSHKGFKSPFAYTTCQLHFFPHLFCPTQNQVTSWF